MTVLEAVRRRIDELSGPEVPKPDVPQAGPAAQAPEMQGSSAAFSPPAAGTGIPAASAPAAAAQSAPGRAHERRDIGALLAQLAEQRGFAGDWRRSVGDLLELLGLEDGQPARTSLARELGVHVEAEGSAVQEAALHQELMRRLG